MLAAPGLLQVPFLVAYFVPAAIALIRHHHNKWAIVALNVLLGWTLFGWIAAFIWALTNPRQVVVREQGESSPPAVPDDG